MTINEKYHYEPLNVKKDEKYSKIIQLDNEVILKMIYEYINLNSKKTLKLNDLMEISFGKILNRLWVFNDLDKEMKIEEKELDLLFTKIEINLGKYEYRSLLIDLLWKSDFYISNEIFAIHNMFKLIMSSDFIYNYEDLTIYGENPYNFLIDFNNGFGKMILDNHIKILFNELLEFGNNPTYILNKEIKDIFFYYNEKQISKFIEKVNPKSNILNFDIFFNFLIMLGEEDLYKIMNSSLMMNINKINLNVEYNHYSETDEYLKNDQDDRTNALSECSNVAYGNSERSENIRLEINNEFNKSNRFLSEESSSSTKSLKISHSQNVSMKNENKKIKKNYKYFPRIIKKILKKKKK